MQKESVAADVPNLREADGILSTGGRWCSLPTCVRVSEESVVDGQKLVWSPTCVRRGVWRRADPGVVPVRTVSSQEAVLSSQDTAADVYWTNRRLCNPYRRVRVTDGGRTAVVLQSSTSRADYLMNFVS